MLPGTWAYVSAGAFGRAIIVSLYLVPPPPQNNVFCMLVVFAIQSLLEFFGPPLASFSFSFHPFLCVFCD